MKTALLLFFVAGPLLFLGVVGVLAAFDSLWLTILYVSVSGYLYGVALAAIEDRFL